MTTTTTTKGPNGTDMMNPPLLFLDVDGPLNPYDADPNRRPDGYQTHRMRPTGWQHPRQKPLRVWLNPAHGPALLALPFELVWATTWGHEANEWIGPRIGLPALPVVPWVTPADLPPSVLFKTPDIIAYAAGRPFAWVDDEIDPADSDFVRRHHPGDALLHHVNPRLGLLPGDFAVLATWAATLEPGGAMPVSG